MVMASLWSRGMEELFRPKGTQEEIQKPIDEEVETLKPTHDEETRKEAVKLDQKEVENKSDGVVENENDVEAELELSEENEEYIKNEIKKLDLLKQETISEKEKLLVLTDELEKRTAELSQQKQQIHDEHEKLNVKKELLLKEVEDLKQERKVFEVEWEALSLRREALSNTIYPKEIECLSAENGSFEKEKRDIADIDELVMVSEKLKDQLRKFSEKRARFHAFVVDKLKDCENCGYIARHYALADEPLEEVSLHKTNAGRSPTDHTDLKSAELSGGHVSWLQNCRSRIFSLSHKTTTKHLSESSLADKTGFRKRTRAEQTSIMKEADADTRKRRQTVTPLKDPVQHFASYKQIETQLIKTPEQGLHGNSDAADFKIVEVIDDTPEYNVEDEHGGLILQGDGGDDNSEEEEEEDPGETSMGRKIWNFLTT